MRRGECAMSERNEDLFRQRVEKLERLRGLGVDPYPTRSHCTHKTTDAVALFTSIEAGTSEAGQEVAVCGRIRLFRPMGKAGFMHIEDEAGRLQVYYRLDGLGEQGFAVVKELDLGDIVEVHGPMMR